MEYNRPLEIALLKFLRVRIGTPFTPDELFEAATKLAACNREQFDIILRIMAVEELINVGTTSGDTSFEILNITGITKDGLHLLRDKKY